jgi:transcriptional regulator with XRE-family HTH domain
MLDLRRGGNRTTIEATDATTLSAVAGEILRQVRLARSLSLRQVTVRSGGRFKPSSVASYERGERKISLERLFALAEVYDMAPERIVAAIAHSLEAERTGAEVDQRRRGGSRKDTVVVLDPLGLEVDDRPRSSSAGSSLRRPS